MNGFILVFDMVLVLAAERRLAADRAAAGGPARSRQSRPVAECPARSRRPPPVVRYPSAAGNPPRPWAAAVPWPGAWALADGKMLAKCVPQRPTVARYRRGAFPGGDPWQFFHFMRSRRGLGREKRQFAATYRRHSSKTSRLWQDMRAVHPKSPANGRSGMHRANTLPRRGPFRCASPSNHARRADLAVVRRSPGAGPYAWKVGVGLRKRTPYCCRRSRVPARHLVAFCGGCLSRSRAPRPAARRDRPALQPMPRPLSVGSGFP